MKRAVLGILTALATAGCGPDCPDGRDTRTWYADLDGDGHGDPGAPTEACRAPWAHVAAPDDCDDGDPDIRPGRIDLCNDVDDDCDGAIDEDGVDEQLFLDADGDGVGSSVSWTGCGVAPSPLYRAEVSGDCDDRDRSRRPGAAERCNGVDDDCDGEVDEDANDTVRLFVDNDGDGFGSTTQLESCPGTPGTAAEGGDCDDGDDEMHPDAPERCNGTDDDCDGYTDEQPSDGALFYVDLDGDGWGGGAVVPACEEGDAWAALGAVYIPYYYDDYAPYYDESYQALTLVPVVATGGDCTDFDPTRNPDALEICDHTDNNCDGQIDDDDESLAQDQAPRWFLDADGDGYGRDDVVAFACDRPPSFASPGGDCDDGAFDVKPYATEVCDGIDNDCDGLIDQSQLGPGGCP